MTLTKDFAWNLVQEHVQDPGLRRHMKSVGVAMAAYADKLGTNRDYWEAVGIVHDFDWEIHPKLGEHPNKGADILRNRGVDEETVRIVLSHYTEGTGVERSKPVDFALLACDEVTGLLVAASLVRPSKDIREMKLKSVRKKWKDRRFAAGVDRSHVEEVTADFSRVCFDGRLDLWEHIDNVMVAMQQRAEELGLAGV
ncbi:MAG: HDIG domain-containing protein [Ardenticatenaceae bacterium]|nr:HDIG domain-containing protein [Ardenticatenaceae bacterium]